jgi:hypothetical protein
MKAIAARIRRLETRTWPQPDRESHRSAMVLYERRRRRAETEGRPFTDKPPVLSVGPTLSIAETLRRKRAEWRAALDAETQR